MPQHSFFPKIQPAEQFIGDGSGGFGKVFGMESVQAVGSQDGDDVAGAGIGDAGDVYYHLIHADVSYDVGFLATD